MRLEGELDIKPSKFPELFFKIQNKLACLFALILVFCTCPPMFLFVEYAYAFPAFLLRLSVPSVWACRFHIFRCLEGCAKNHKSMVRTAGFWFKCFLSLFFGLLGSVLSLELRGHAALFPEPVSFMLSIGMIGTTILTILLPIVLERTEINQFLKEMKSSERRCFFYTLLLTALFIQWMTTVQIEIYSSP